MPKTTGGITGELWHLCNDGKCPCKQIWADDYPVAKIIWGKWGDDYPSLKLVGDSLALKAEPYMGQITYGEIPEEVATANAKLIVSAINACKSVNPSNPMAVAEKIGEMARVLIWCAEYFGTRKPNGELPNRADCAREIDELLADIERKE